ncbi:MAG: beta-ketoacyl synthase N-terminal-like domain-containing protein [Desulfobacterales bacterium]
MKAAITGIGWVTPNSMGCGRHHDHFEWKAGNLPEIKRKVVFEEPFPHFGRLDRFCRLGLAAIAFALKDAGLNRWKHKRPIGIVASTVYGCLETDINYFDTVMPEAGRLASPNLFAYTLPNSFLGEAAIYFGLTGPSFIVSQPERSELLCIRLSLSAMADGQFNTVISGIGDLNRPPQYAQSRDTACGALFFVIENSVSKKRAAYGELHLNQDGRLTLDGREIKTMARLARLCVTAMARRKEILNQTAL